MIKFFQNFRNDKGSVTLWVTISLPVLVLLFMFLFLRVNNVYDGRRYLQNVGDLASEAAVSQIDMNSMFEIPQNEELPQPTIDEEKATEIAKEYLKNNFSEQSNMFAEDVELLVEQNDLTIDEFSYKPTIADEDGVAIVILEGNGSELNPLTGKPVTAPSVLIVSQFRLMVMLGTQVVTTYSIASF